MSALRGLGGTEEKEESSGIEYRKWKYKNPPPSSHRSSPFAVLASPTNPRPVLRLRNEISLVARFSLSPRGFYLRQSASRRTWPLPQAQTSLPFLLGRCIPHQEIRRRLRWGNQVHHVHLRQCLRDLRRQHQLSLWKPSGYAIHPWPGQQREAQHTARCSPGRYVPEAVYRHRRQGELQLQ